MGFKDLCPFNDELLAKKTWRLLHDKNSLFYWVFKVKFFPNNLVMEASSPSSASYAWKTILRGRKVIQRGASWRVGDGKSINIWEDRWLPRKHFPKVLSSRSNILPSTKVCSLIHEDQKCWRIDLLELAMLSFEATMIKSIHLRNTEQPDERI